MRRLGDCFQVSAKDATNVEVAFRQVAVAAFQHFKEIKAQQEQEYERPDMILERRCQPCCAAADGIDDDTRLVVMRANLSCASMAHRDAGS